MNVFERYLHHLRRWWWVVVITTFVAVAASYGIAHLSPGPYRATSTLLVNLNQTPDTIVLDDVLLSQRLTATYEQLITTRPVLAEAASRLDGGEDGDELRDRIAVSAVAGTQLIRIDAEGDAPDGAAATANMVAQVFIERVNQGRAGLQPGAISVVEPARPPQGRAGPSPLARIVLGALAGVSLGLIAVMGRTYFDRAVWDVEDLQGLDAKAPLLGVLLKGELIPGTALGRNSHLPPISEPCRVLAANVLTQLGRSSNPEGSPRTVAVMSASPGEGRTSLAARLAVVITLDGHRVTLVDFDCASPSLHREFGLSDEPDVGAVSPQPEVSRTPSGNARKAEALRGARSSVAAAEPTTSLLWRAEKTPLDGLEVIACPPYDSSETRHLSLQDARAVLEDVKADSPDLILVDAPPFAAGADAVVAGQLADCAILVVEATKTPAESVASVLGQLDAMGLPVLGVVLNKR